jgi:hypothetical protein
MAARALQLRQQAKEAQTKFQQQLDEAVADAECVPRLAAPTRHRSVACATRNSVRGAFTVARLHARSELVVIDAGFGNGRLSSSKAARPANALSARILPAVAMRRTRSRCDA